MSELLHISFGSKSDTGLVKEFNTDALIDFKILHGHVLAVCDGHDGEQGHGALAAKIIAESIKKYFFNRSYKDMAKALTNAITYANYTLFEQVQKDQKYKGVGSTLAILIYRAGKIHYAYAGDSRIYVYKNSKLQPLTRDHVSDMENVAEAEVEVLLGRTRDIKFGVCKNPLPAVENELFLICTDGLTDLLSEAEISAILADADKAPEHKCQELIDSAKEKGGTDCISVQVVEFNKAQEPVKTKTSSKMLQYVAIAVLAVSAISFGAYKGIEYFVNKPEKVVNEKKVKPAPDKKKAKVTESKQLDETSEKAALPAQEKAKETIPQPVVENTTPAPEKKDSKPALVSNEQVYHMHKVKYGENLYRLGLRYHVAQKQLIDINGSKATKLVAGSTIKIPVKALHKVKSGESFSVISDKYNVKIKLICAATGISETTPLKDGMTLVIPL